MEYNFDLLHNRKQTGSVKWDFNQQTFGRGDILPLWVADMDFQVPEPVLRALTERAEQGIYGYSEGLHGYYESLMTWMRNYHGWEIEKDWIMFSPGVVTALNGLIQVLTQPGDSVLIQTPVYPPFSTAVQNHGRELVKSPLKIENGRYTMDFKDLEANFAQGVKTMILCSPHNPVGRVWNSEELGRLAKLALKYKVLIISDEIHGDLIYEGHQHIPFTTLTPELEACSVVCTSPSKTFNLAGLQTSNIIIPNPEYRQAYRSYLLQNGIHHPNVFGMVAQEAAYRYGREWLEQLMVYLKGNIDYVMEFLATELTQVHATRPEGTYLAWLDFRELGITPLALQEFLVHKAGIGLNAGHTFGPGGEGFARLNLASPRSMIIEGLERIKRAIQE